ncbi:MAG: hypothetical protein D4R64_09275 [Porphyromonadaceae bacterium]|nr:MAG: hypothetical protein D4R64_09275 [Porphyromonadaceae bacterium]
MGAIFRIILVSLKYLVNIGPLVYEGTKWGIRIVKEFRMGKKVLRVLEPGSEKASTATKEDFDPG